MDIWYHQKSATYDKASPFRWSEFMEPASASTPAIGALDPEGRNLRDMLHSFHYKNSVIVYLESPRKLIASHNSRIKIFSKVEEYKHIKINSPSST